MKRFLFILLLICIGTGYSYAQYDYLLDKTFAERVWILDSIIQEQPNKSIDLYNNIEQFAQQHNDNQLQQHVNIAKYDKQLTEVGANDLLPEFLKLLQNLKQTKEPYLYPYALYVYANYLSFVNNNIASFEQQLKAYDIYDPYSILDYPIKVRAIRNLGSEYYRYKDYINVIELYRKIIIDSAKNNQYNFPAANAIALSYRTMGVYDSAMYYFEQIIEHAIQKQNNGWKLITELNIGHTYYMRGSYDKAKDVFTNTYNISKKKNIEHGICESATILSKLALRDNDILKAKQLATEAEHAYNHHPKWYWTKTTDAKALFSCFEKIYLTEGNYKLAYLYADSARMVTDSFNKTYNKNLASVAEKNLLLSKYEQEKQNLRLEKKQQSQMRNAIILGIILLSIISILFINRQRIRRKQLMAEKQIAEEKLEASKQKLSVFTKNLQEKNNLIEQFKEEVAQYKNQANEEAQAKTLLALQESTILTDEDWVNFRHMFEQVHVGFSNRLKVKLPDLTPGEVRFMVLSKLKLSTKEMANILGVGASTIRKYKHQVRHKLGLPEDGSIDEVIDII